jgi:hypothetical protein
MAGQLAMLDLSILSILSHGREKLEFVVEEIRWYF